MMIDRCACMEHSAIGRIHNTERLVDTSLVLALIRTLLIMYSFLYVDICFAFVPLAKRQYTRFFINRNIDIPMTQ